MDALEAKVLLRNLLDRIQRLDDGTMNLPGVLTTKEVEALRYLIDDDRDPTPVILGNEHVEAPVDLKRENVELDLTSLGGDEPVEYVRVCLDFGTAMSKATLIDDRDEGVEAIEVLQLGIPGDQQEVDDVMLVSSVYIDNDGMLRFGHAAFEKSLLEGDDGSRQRLDNIKRRLSEDGWEENVGQLYNPTDIPVTYGDLVLAYLSYMTWTVNCCLEELGYRKLVRRRFALPCFDGPKRRESIERLGRAVGEAQVLADTFGGALRDGIPLVSFVDAVGELRTESRQYGFVDRDVVEPLGVAGSMISWRRKTDSLVLVVDVGAGTSDLGLFRIHIDPDGQIQDAYQVEGSTRVLTEAGNYLDNVLIEFVLAKAEVTVEHPMAKEIRGKLNLQIREYKETLFSEGSVFVVLTNVGQPFEVTVDLEEFRQLAAVQQFGQSLSGAVVDILESVDDSWVGWIRASPMRRLGIMLTGGGASLPMVKELGRTPLVVHGDAIEVARAPQIPSWLSEGHGIAADDYTRVAVSLGGARRQVMDGKGATITAGDVTAPPRIGGYYQKGQ